MNNPEFTLEQKKWLFELIDEWYEAWEGCIPQIPFEYAKNVLKRRVSGLISEENNDE